MGRSKTMAQKSYDEKLEEILKKKEQLEAHEKAIKKRKSFLIAFSCASN